MDIVLGVGLNVAGKRGIDYYIDNLVEWLARLDARNHYTLSAYFFGDHAAKTARLPHPERPNFELRAARVPERLVDALERAGVPAVKAFVLGGRTPDVYHALTGMIPRLRGAKTVATVYDLGPERARRARADRTPGTYALPGYRNGLLRCDRLIAVSETTKRDLVEIYGADASKIDVIPTGVNPLKLKPVADPAVLADARRRYGLPERYVVLLGPFEPRRNAEAVLEAAAAVRGERDDFALALVGADGPYRRGLEEKARALGLGGRVVACGYVREEDFAAVFSGALALAHPTRMEGFGTVSLEAMACGCPALTSSIPPVVEAVGDAAFTVAPDDRAALARALRELVSNPEERARRRAAGLARAALFSYDKLAARVLALYERLAAERKTP
jgi:glycosyltransferase involved in cell wall biosynthesis